MVRLPLSPSSPFLSPLADTDSLAKRDGGDMTRISKRYTVLSRKKGLEKKVSKIYFFIPIRRSRLLFQTLRKVTNLPVLLRRLLFPLRLRRPTGDCNSSSNSSSNNNSSSSPRRPPSAAIPLTSPASPPPSPEPQTRTRRRRTRMKTRREMTETRGTFANIIFRGMCEIRECPALE